MAGWSTVRSLLSQVPCLQLRQAPEIFGPTDLNAQSGNGGLSVGLNRQGTVTVLRWPRPSFYDQINYYTTDRDAPRMGAAPNAGAFLGLALDTEWGRETVWLRTWASEQRYLDDRSDAVETVYREDGFDLEVRVRDVVAPTEDLFLREVEVACGPGSPVESASLLAVENCALVVSKRAGNPIQDWCREGENTDRARYRPGADAIVHTKAGTDASTGEERSVAIGMGFDRPSAGYQVGRDAHLSASGAGPQDAYEDANEGGLSGNEAYEGNTTGALAADLDLDGDAGSDAVTVLFAAAESASDTCDLLERGRERDPGTVRAEKRAWYDNVLGEVPMPDTDDEAVNALAARALVTLAANYDRESGALVASVATQSPYALDWVRDGAFFNHALDMLGLHDWVRKRNLWYADLQAGEDADIPAGTWAMNYYGDGTVGGPIPYEIDEVAYGAWTLWDHYAVTDNEDYLREVWPAIERAADFLVAHRDPETGLHARAHEDDNAVPSQSIVGAGPIHLALSAAADAAAELGHETAAARYRERREELAAAIDDHLWDRETEAYTGRYPALRWARGLPVVGDLLRNLPVVPAAVADPAVAWPVGFEGRPGRMDAHREHLWESLIGTFREPHQDERHSGLYESQGLIALARAWRDDPDRLERVRRGVRWVAHEHATQDTHVMGEVWMQHGDEIVTTVSQPHTWAQLLFYFAALEAFPPAEVPAGEHAIEYYRERESERLD
jgi:hypothetical protein